MSSIDEVLMCRGRLQQRSFSPAAGQLTLISGEFKDGAHPSNDLRTNEILNLMGASAKKQNRLKRLSSCI